MPLKDDVPLQIIRFQYVTAALLAVNIGIFLLTGPLAGTEAALSLAWDFGVVPAELLSRGVPMADGFNPMAEPFTLITYQFFHGGWLHLITNMAFLWVFADNIEDAFGSPGFLLFYLLCGMAAAAAHVAMAPDSRVPLIGASGAVSGVIGAYLLLYPKARVWVLLFFRIPVKLPAVLVLGAWIALQFYSLIVPQLEGQVVAWWAHIGGLAAGLVLTLVLRSRLLIKA